MAVAVARHSIFRNFLGQAASRRTELASEVALPRCAVLFKIKSAELSAGPGRLRRTAQFSAMPDGNRPAWRNPQPLIEAIALLRGKSVELTPDLPGSQLKSQLPLFLTQATGDEERQLSAPPPRFVLFVLTDGNGRQLFVYAVVFGCAAGEVAALCVVSRARCYPTPFRDVLVHLLRTASPLADGDAVRSRWASTSRNGVG